MLGAPLALIPGNALHGACQLPGQESLLCTTTNSYAHLLFLCPGAPHSQREITALMKAHTEVAFLRGESQVSKLNPQETAGDMTLGLLSLTSKCRTIGEASSGWEEIS